MFRHIRWRIAIPHVLLIVLVMSALAVSLSSLSRRVLQTDLREQLASEARLLADWSAPLVASHADSDALDRVARRAADLTGRRVTFIASDGTVIGESHADRTQMDNHANRPEVSKALHGREGSDIRFSHTQGQTMMYVAVPIRSGSGLIGVARVSLSLAQVDSRVADLQQTIFTAAGAATVLATLTSLLIAERIARPVRELTAVAERLSKGDLNARLTASTRDEVGRLTLSFNRMARRLQEQVASLSRERSRLAGILEHMADPVIITDREGQVQLVNAAATRLLAVHPPQAVGHSFRQLVRHPRLLELWRQAAASREEQTATIDTGAQGTHLHAIITPLEQTDEQGYLVMLHDLTRLRQLEAMRRDLVSNISHELRTPLASLKALTDTLRDGALQDPEAAQRFLDRMEVEVDALIQLVQELLELARIESGKAPLHLRATPVESAIIPPVERLRAQAERAGLTLAVELRDGLPHVLVDTERIHQVMTNLVHNAIKFTPHGGRITVSAEPRGDRVVIAVADTGVGIAPEDQPRIFERFYKADLARSGGGTGLGLAIAKHIVQAHNGHIWVESQEGRGSTFCFSIPVAHPER